MEFFTLIYQLHCTLNTLFDICAKLVPPSLSLSVVFGGTSSKIYHRREIKSIYLPLAYFRVQEITIHRESTTRKFIIKSFVHRPYCVSILIVILIVILTRRYRRKSPREPAIRYRCFCRSAMRKGKKRNDHRVIGLAAQGLGSVATRRRARASGSK